MAFDPTFRGNSSAISTGGLSSVSPNPPTGSQAGDLFIVTGIVNGAIKINPPDGTWTRINGDVTGYQSFSKIYSVGMGMTFTWDGTNQPFVFSVYASYSAGGGTVKIDSAITKPDSGSAQTKTSNAVTPSQNALVIVDFIEFVNAFLGVLSSPFTAANTTQPGNAGGYESVASGVASDTWTEPNGDDSVLHYWGSGTFAIITSGGFPPLLSDELFSPPAIRTPADVLYMGGDQQLTFAIFSGGQLKFTPSAGIKSGNLLLVHIWSNGVDPGKTPFPSIPTGWALLDGSYITNYTTLPPSASWIFYKIATGSEPTSYMWKMPVPTLNEWSGILYFFYNVDPVTPFSAFKAATGQSTQPQAPSVTPNFSNDIALLLFTAINDRSQPPWPSRPDAPSGYIRLASIQNQGNFQLGYLGAPNSCNPVPAVFAYTDAEAIAELGHTAVVSSWMSYAFLLKNNVVTGLSCAGGGGGGGGASLFNDTILLRYMGTSKGFSLMKKLPGGAQIITLREVQTPKGGTGNWSKAGDGDAVIMALTNDLNTYILFAGSQDGTVTATAVTQPLPTPGDIPEEYWDTDKHFDYLYAEGADLTNFQVSFSLDGGLTFNTPQALTKKFKVGMRGKSLVIKLTHSVATSITPLISHLKLTYGIEGLTAQ